LVAKERQYPVKDRAGSPLQEKGKKKFTGLRGGKKISKTRLHLNGRVMGSAGGKGESVPTSVAVSRDSDKKKD